MPSVPCEIKFNREDEEVISTGANKDTSHLESKIEGEHIQKVSSQYFILPEPQAFFSLLD